MQAKRTQARRTQSKKTQAKRTQAKEHFFTVNKELFSKKKLLLS